MRRTFALAFLRQIRFGHHDHGHRGD